MTRIREGDADITIDDRPPLPGSYRIEEQVITLDTTATAPDPTWNTVDAQGHWHAWTDDGKLPTLRTAPRHVPCDGTDHPGTDGDLCDGYDAAALHCRICGEQITPRRIPAPHPTTVAVAHAWTVTLTAHPDAPAPKSPAAATIRIRTSTGELLFGVAVPGPADRSADGTTVITFEGQTHLGHRHPPRAATQHAAAAARAAARIRAAAYDAQSARTQLGTLIAESCPGPHHYIQHRDHKPPWCPACRYTPDGTYIPDSGNSSPR
jgi:hypothetical protein